MVNESLAKMLAEAHPAKAIEAARKVCETLNHLVHGDPNASEFNLVALSDDAWGYGVGRVLNNPELCDFVCDEAVSWLAVLASKYGWRLLSKCSISAEG